MKFSPFKPWEAELAFRYLRAKRHQGGVALISIISFVGVMLAVAVLIIVMSVMNGFRTELLSRMLGFNGHVFVGEVTNLSPPALDQIVARIRALPEVQQAVPIIEAYALAIGPAPQPAPAVVRGISPADLRATPIIAENIRAGSLEGFGEGEYGGDIVVIGDLLAASLGVRAGDVVQLTAPGGQATPFGEAPTTTKNYIVGGIFSIGLSEFDQTFMYMPLEQAQLFFGRGEGVDTVEIRLDDADRVDRVVPAIREAVGPAGVVVDWRERNRSFFGALQVERSVMRLILMLIVAIAAMNIISGLVMLVKNKGRDIAVLRTMGARRSAVLRVFFLSGASIGAAGTLAGLIIGSVFCIYIGPIQGFVEAVTGQEVFSAEQYYLDHLPAEIEWSEVAIVTFWSLLMACLATLPPAIRASRLDPVEALRYE